MPASAGTRGDDGAYWRLVARYCIDGGLQAVLDEYIHHLAGESGADTTTDEGLISLASTGRRAIALRESVYRATDIDNFDGEGIAFPSRYALRFGSTRSSQDEARLPEVRAAFNSPFWPFVLATTSVGQEGIDFHWWCHSVVHWNLPANPVDFEQREGRVDRYKGRDPQERRCRPPVGGTGRRNCHLRPTPETSSSPTAAAQAPTSASIPVPTAAPVEVPTPTKVPEPTKVPAPTETPIPTAMPVPTDAPSETTPESGMPGPTGMNDTGLLTSDLSDAELSCLSEIGDPQQLVTLMNSPDLASPQERDAMLGCLEHETLLKLFLNGFTDQTGPLSDDTSACVSAGFQNFDLRAMMLANQEGSGEEAAMVQGMAGFLITLSCLNEEEWQAASPALDLPPEGREAMQCVMNMLGGPEGIAASLESKEGEPPLAFFSAAAECGMMMGVPSG